MAKVEPTQDKIIAYPITGDERGGRLFLFGPTNATHVVLFCAGFPDDHSAFAPLAARFAKETGALCGVACLTGYDDCPEKEWSSYRPQGYTMNEWAIDLRAAARLLREHSTNEAAKYVAVFHDWACIAGTMYLNRVIEEGDANTTPSKVVYFDVLPFKAHPNEPSPPTAEKKDFKSIITEWLYRYAFAITYWVQWRLSRHLATAIFLVSVVLLQVLGLSPGGKKDDETIQKNPKDTNRMIYMMFPYFHLLKELLKGHDMVAAGLHLPLLNKTPVLYMYGKDKRGQFHDANLADFVGTKKGSRAIGVDGAGHWLYLQQEDKCYEAVKAFIFE
jgi:pimeloyl-ACP methyl ester carboxylesterase